MESGGSEQKRFLQMLGERELHRDAHGCCSRPADSIESCMDASEGLPCATGIGCHMGETFSSALPPHTAR